MTALIQADIRRFPLPDKSVNLICTSPPYYGQRRYAGGEAQLGSEPTPEEYLANLYAFMQECWRVLTDDGLAFINLGDKRAGSVAPGTTSGLGGSAQGKRTELEGAYTKAHFGRRKSRQMLPWRFALGCIDGEGDPDGIGWIVSEYVWAKPNGMPESVGDRCRDSHEYIFQMAKSERWFTGIDEIREPYAPATADRYASGFNVIATEAETTKGYSNADGGPSAENPLGKLPASVWTIPTESLRIPEAVLKHYNLPEHFAAFPQEIPRRIILGWSPSAVCCVCGEGRRPVTTSEIVKDRGGRQFNPQSGNVGVLGKEREFHHLGYACACTPRTSHRGKRGDWTEGREVMPEHGSDDLHSPGPAVPRRPGGFGTKVPPPERPMIEYHLDGWTPPPSRPAVVLDPFLGTGTTLGVARALGRIGIGLDLSFDYLRLARWRIEESGHFAKTAQRTHKENQGSLL